MRSNPKKKFFLELNALYLFYNECSLKVVNKFSEMQKCFSLAFVAFHLIMMKTNNTTTKILFGSLYPGMLMRKQCMFLKRKIVGIVFS